MQKDFFNNVGKLALGSRLRMLTAKITEDAKKIYELYDIELEPKWFPVFYILSETTKKTITEIANEIGHSQPSVSKIIREMSKQGLVLENRNSTDGRRNVIKLSKKGIGLTKKIKHQYADVSKAVESISAQTRNDLWKAIEEWEFLLEQKPLLQRVKEKRKERESMMVKIVPYHSKYREAFKELNKEWISTYFKMEDADNKALNNPEKYILDKGGCILVALYNDEPAGVCALIKMNDPDYDFELAKMAVSPKVQGKNIGWLLGVAILEKAKKLKASSIYLESNTILKPAINLYHKLGFQKISGRSTPYERCNIQMALVLNK
jgi:DNA-binding MarR family transcriptional regulator/predicted GNAT family N-acyltransferase